MVTPADPAPPAPASPAAAPSVGPPPRHITKLSVASWVLYDLANTVYSMNISSLYFSLWVREQVGMERADFVFPLTMAVAMGTIFLLSPILGALTDFSRRRVPFLMVSTLICVGLTALLGQGGEWRLAFSLLCFVIATIAFNAGLQFYDALLPEVSTEQNRGWIGGIGIGIGYCGSFLGIGTGYYLTQVLKLDLVYIFPASAALFILFAWPAFVFVRERGNPAAQPFTWGLLGQATRQVFHTFRHVRQYPGLARFLIGRVIYTDPLNTVIAIMGLYVTNLAVRAGRSEADASGVAQQILFVAVAFSVAGGFAWGRLVDSIGPKRTLQIVLVGWMGCLLAGAAMGFFGWPMPVFFVIACATGLCMGGTWAADRPLMLRLAPPRRIGEFYGLYGMVGRFSAITGPLMWSIVVGYLFRHGDQAIGQAVGLLVMLVYMVVAFCVLWPLSDAPRAWPPDECRADEI